MFPGLSEGTNSQFVLSLNLTLIRGKKVSQTGLSEFRTNSQFVLSVHIRTKIQ